MPIIIKEVIVRTTVESKKTPQEILPEEWMEKMKRVIIEDLRPEDSTERTGKVRKDR